MLAESKQTLCALFFVCFFCIFIGSRSYISGDKIIFSLPQWYKTSRNPNLNGTKYVNKTFIIKSTVNNTLYSVAGNAIDNKLEAINALRDAATVNCTPRAIRLSSKVLPVTGLVSFPGSGNTWTRHLIQQMTGIGTSSVYCDRGLKSWGFPHECHRDFKKTIVVKTHEARSFRLFDKIALIIRNPYDAMLSYASFTRAGHTGRPSKQALIAGGKMFNGSLKWYTNLTNSTIGIFKGPVHIIQYERLRTDMTDELTKLATFLNVSISQRDLECTVKLQEGKFHRHVSTAEHLELLHAVYDNDKLLRMQQAARYTEKLLKEAYELDIELGGSIEDTLFGKT